MNILEVDPNIGAVVVGFDSMLTYGTPFYPFSSISRIDVERNLAKIAFAYYQISNNPHCLFIATSTDSTVPSQKGLIPGTVLFLILLTC